MSGKFFVFIGWSFIVGTLLSLAAEGMFFGAGHVDLMNHLTGYNVAELNSSGGLAGLAKTGVGFFTNGVPAMLTWDYTFLDGSFGVVKWILLYPLSMGVVWGISVVFISAVQGIFR